MKKILIVDDYEENRYLLEVLFKSHGFKITSVANGESALKQARLELPDIIVSDILMPVMDGYALCRNWMADDTLKNIPFVFYTATYTDPKDEEFALSLGADRFIKKPIEGNDLAKIVIEVLNEDRGQKTGARTEKRDEAIYFKQYNETLIRKLEQKMFQLEKTNALLLEEINERKKAEDALKISLGEKEILLRELYHRTRNNMQLICSLLSIKLSYRPSAELDSFVKDMHSRIGSMALVHKKLYDASDLSNISVDEYIRELCDSLIVYGGVQTGKVTFKFDMENIRVQIEIAAPIGIFLHELISNSLRHAFTGGRDGQIEISLHRDAENLLELKYSDNGRGLPAGFDYKSNGKMGFELISIIVINQLRGAFDIIPGGGFKCLIRINDSSINYLSDLNNY